MPRIAQRYVKHYKSWPMLLLMAIALTFLIWLIGNAALLRNLEEGSTDLRFRLGPQMQKADSSIVMVAIDDASLKYAQQQLNQGWPWPRQFYAVITSFLESEGAKATVFDINFDEPDLDRGDLDAEESDAEFAEALADNENAILALSFTRYKTAQDALIRPFAFPAGEPQKELQKWPGALSLHPPFAEAAHLGGISLAPSSSSTIRRVPLIYPYGMGYIPSLALQAYALHHDIAPILKRAQPPDGSMYLNWHGPAGPENGAFRYIPFSQLLESAIAEINGFEPPIPKGWFKDRYVFIGAVASGLQDLKSSPYTWGTPGIEIWATQLSNLLGDNFISFPPVWLNLLITFILCLLTLAFVMRLQGLSSSLVPALLIIIFSVVSVYLFASQRIALSYSSGIMAIGFSWLIGLTLSYTVEGRQKRELRRVFNRYLHPDLVQSIVEEPDQVCLGGQKLSATIMFSDIYDFTTFSEHTQPQDLVSYLNDYFTTLTGMILDHKGLLDKYTGDGLMAVFGAPTPIEEHSLLACQAALAHRDFCKSLPQNDSENPVFSFHLNTRLGIHSGEVVSGNVGSERRMDYTSIGDAVNLSARLEGVNKIYRTHIILSEDTYLQVKDRMFCRELDSLKVKGKKQPTAIYELIGRLEDTNPADYAWFEDYASALRLYRESDFAAAEKAFAGLCEDPVKDRASAAMRERCKLLLSNPPTDWDGVFELKDK